MSENTHIDIRDNRGRFGKGRKHSAEELKIIGETIIRLRKGKTYEEIYGKEKSEEVLKKIRDRVTLKCKECGKDFEVIKAHKNQQCCSRTCAGNKRKHIRQTKVCPVCKQNFLAYPSSSKLFCSRKCLDIGFKDCFSEHKEEIHRQKKILEEQGFKCLLADEAPKPDIIARKDNMVYAIEVELSGYPNYKKYFDNDFFDDIIWLVEREGKLNKKDKYGQSKV